ncbi:hypothetical protein QEG98_01135 [Myxococcus sp. MxC21-1]|uniref:hypothetical protein n=1 Tax=Myxococcus sp. MxC21-1 TaxID=3041439 RepID=UPI00292D6EE7|nr:hypothetical protein [Myxococcus sp. MxC21-1]WNZ62485.1 hypothetical protein QEG98_01135 [Myxococcus sp. MxC21-1]
MRAVWMMLGVLWLGCSVQLTGAPCLDDLNCLEAEHCGPESVCVKGARTAQMLGESCHAAMRSIAARVSECLSGSVEDVIKVIGPTDVCRSVEASVAAGRQVFRPEAFGACVRYLRQDRPCGELSLEMLAQGSLLEGCEAFAPQVAKGGACGNSADCQDGWCSATEACPGVCRPFIPFGEACAASGDPCQRGSSCEGDICRRYVGEGERCGLGGQCELDSNTYCHDGRCVKRRTEGACEEDEQCSLRYRCVKTHPELGGSSPKECRPVKAPEEACEPDVGGCELFSYCDRGTRRCRSWPGLGAQCGNLSDTGEFVFCLESRCDPFRLNPVCEGFAPVGGWCMTSVECGPSKACRDRRCVPQWCG